MTTRIKPQSLVIASSLIFLCAAIADAKGWKGIVPLRSTRAQVEQILGPPTEEDSSYSAFYRTPTETAMIYYAQGLPCGIGQKYSPWRVARNIVTRILVTPTPGSPLSQLSIDESKYKKFIVGHLLETRYISASEGEAITVVGDEIRSISYFAAAEDSDLECPGLPRANHTNCEYVLDPFESLDDMEFEQEKVFLDNFFVAVSDKKAIAYIIAYGGKRAHRDEAKQRAERAKEYLVAVRHFPENRIKVIDGGYREKRHLELYVVSEGVCLPTPRPNVDPRDVVIIPHGREE
jgi:hypothetical protein